MKKEVLDYREQNAKNISKHISNKVYVIMYPDDHEYFMEFRYITNAEYIKPNFKDGQIIPIEELYAICDYNTLLIKKPVEDGGKSVEYFEGKGSKMSIDILKCKQVPIETFLKMKELVDESNNKQE